MTTIRLGALAALALSLSLSLGGCALLGGGEKATLYRFGQPALGGSEPAAAAPAAAEVPVFRVNGAFQREAAGDRILAVTGGKVAYIAETRWVAPASTLFNQAVTAAFDASPGPVRLIPRGEPAPAQYVLRLDVRNFETHYDRGGKAAPMVLVRVRAALARGGEGSTDRLFEAQVRAGGNRVSSIVEAYDEAVAEVLGEVTAWTNGQVSPAA